MRDIAEISSLSSTSLNTMLNDRGNISCSNRRLHLHRWMDRLSLLRNHIIRDHP